MRITDTDRQIDMYGIPFATTHSRSLISMAQHSFDCWYFCSSLHVFFYLIESYTQELAWFDRGDIESTANRMNILNFCTSVCQQKIHRVYLLCILKFSVSTIVFYTRCLIRKCNKNYYDEFLLEFNIIPFLPKQKRRTIERFFPFIDKMYTYKMG